MNNSGEFRILFALVCFLAVAFCSRDVCYADMVTIKAESLEEDIRKDDCLSKFVKENVPSDAYLVDSEFLQNLLEIKKVKYLIYQPNLTRVFIHLSQIMMKVRLCVIQ